MRKNAIVHGLQRRDENGKIIPARKTGPPCNCKENCFQRVDDGLKFHILTSFNCMPDKAKQDQYLSGMVLAFDPTWVGAQGRGGRFSETNRGKKLNTFQYYVPTGNLTLTIAYILLLFLGHFRHLNSLLTLQSVKKECWKSTKMYLE